jgi:hypothetical protein
MQVDEAAFEAEIVADLVAHGGYEENGGHDFDTTAGLDFAVTLAFIGATQDTQWKKLEKIHGDTPAAQRAFKARLAKELNRGAPWTCCGTAWWTTGCRSGWRTSGRHTGSRRTLCGGTNRTGSR